MKIKTIYIADNGKKFETEEECREYEKNIKKKLAIQKTMCELDEKIWKIFYPNDKENELRPELHVAHVWLRNDIVHILTDANIDITEAEKKILSIIKKAEHGEDILNKYVLMDSIMEEVKIKSDYQFAFSKVKEGSDLASRICYTLGKSDLTQLAKLHKENKCRKKIEDLLTNCNFHYECSKFIDKEYEEFLE